MRFYIKITLLCKHARGPLRHLENQLRCDRPTTSFEMKVSSAGHKQLTFAPLVYFVCEGRLPTLVKMTRTRNRLAADRLMPSWSVTPATVTFHP